VTAAERAEVARMLRLVVDDVAAGRMIAETPRERAPPPPWPRSIRSRTNRIHTLGRRMGITAYSHSPLAGKQEHLSGGNN